MSDVAMAFVRRGGAHGAGHVGWSFDIGDGTFLAGSVDNPTHTLHTAPDKMGFWAIRSREPIRVMREHAYTDFKLIQLERGEPEQALQIAAWHSRKPYSLFGCNCMDVAYDILRAYGVPNLPAPAHHWEPNHWFDHLPGPSYPIGGPSPTLAPSMSKRTPTGYELLDTERRFGDLPSAIPDTPPSWRIDHTPEWEELQEDLASAAPQTSARRPTVSVPAWRLIRWLRRLFGQRYERR